MTKNFFKDLPSFTSFEDACNSDNYHVAPEDWYVGLADIEGSTKAIQAGRYKDVNMVGAACITAAVNVCHDIEIPYVFGGDGATFLVPPDCIDAVKQELLALKHRALAMHDLKLRVGAIPIVEIVRKNRRLDVAKFMMSTGCVLAMFEGGGVSYADDLLKSGKFVFEEEAHNYEPDLEGLSCRWQPIPARRGTMLTLLVMAILPGAKNEIYGEVNAFIGKTIATDLSPVHQDNLKYKWPTREALRQSQMVWRQGNVLKNLLFHIFIISFFNILNRFGVKFKGLDVPEYKKDMIINSDYRKFDDMLRMVIDCSFDQAQAIETFLAEKHKHGDIVYGTHYSDTALMTCFVRSLAKDNHIHFIDGNDGGYAIAAKGLKEQLAECQSQAA